MTQTQEQLLGGGGVPAAKFANIGDTVKGIVTAVDVTQQTEFGTGKPKTWDDGSPMMQLVVTLDTDERDADIDEDDGARRIFVRGASKRAGGGSLQAVRDALKKTGAKTVEVGGRLALKYTGDAEKTNPAYNAPKQFTAQYEAPAASASVDAPGLSADELF